MLAMHHRYLFLCVCVSVWVLLRVLSVETDLDVSRVASRRRKRRGGLEEEEEGWWGGRKATVKLKDKKRNRGLEAGRDVDMDDRHMEDIKKG